MTKRQRLGTFERWRLAGIRFLACMEISRRWYAKSINLRDYVEYEDINFDLSGVRTPEQLHAALGQHMELPADWRRMWPAIPKSLSYQERPYTGRKICIQGWHEMRIHMPRYAKRLRRMFDYYARWHPHVLIVEYK